MTKGQAAKRSRELADDFKTFVIIYYDKTKVKRRGHDRFRLSVVFNPRKRDEQLEELMSDSVTDVVAVTIPPSYFGKECK